MSFKIKLKLVEVGTMFSVAMLSGGLVYVLCKLSH